MLQDAIKIYQQTNVNISKYFDAHIQGRHLEGGGQGLIPLHICPPEFEK